jgi:hypothetical protein
VRSAGRTIVPIASAGVAGTICLECGHLIRQFGPNPGTESARLLIQLWRVSVMCEMNLLAAWIAILFGLVTGTAQGLFFHDETWLGGYASWRRRMLRLGHIAFFGTGLLNLAFVLSVEHLRLAQPPLIASFGFVVGSLTMPVVCFLSAWHTSFRHLFFIPVASLIAATADFLVRGLLR